MVPDTIKPMLETYMQGQQATVRRDHKPNPPSFCVRSNYNELFPLAILTAESKGQE
jgi:hypothetical protein